MDSEDGHTYIKHLAHFVRTHEKALANALQLQRRQPRRSDMAPAVSGRTPANLQYAHGSSSTSSTLAAAFSLPSLSFTSQHLKPAKLGLTPHHLYYLLSRFEELNIPVGPMGVRLENIHAESSPGNYVSFLTDTSRRRNHSSDSLSIHSVSSVRSVMSGMSSLWSSIGLGTPASVKSEKAKAALEADLKYLYSAFTKIPCLRLAPDRKSRLIQGFEEFPFDTAVPLLAFKNVSALEICDIDIRQFFGWDQLAERLRSLVVKRGAIKDPAELIIAIVLDDMDKRRLRSAKSSSSPIILYPSSSPGLSNEGEPSTPPSPTGGQIGSSSAPAGNYHAMSRGPSNSSRSSSKNRPRSNSPTRPASSRTNSTATNSHSRSHRMRRSGSGSSHSSSTSTLLPASNHGLTLPANLPNTKWRFLRHLSLAENDLISISSAALTPLAGSLSSLDLSNNHFKSIPECLSILYNLRALNLSGNMIESLHSLTRNPLPAITALNLRGNALASIAGVERLLSLERLDLRENRLTDPTELARLTGVPNIAEIWIASNPFTKTHSSYRVTIFNLFRETPGYSDDISLDSQKPGMMEKRNLKDRVAESPAVPVMRVPPSPTVAVNTVSPMDSKKKDKHDNEKIIKIGNGEVARAKKKVGRRRVVELSRDDSNVSIHQETQSNTKPTNTKPTIVRSASQSRPVVVSSSKQPTAPKEIYHPLEETSSGAESSPPDHHSSPSENVDWAQKGDEYRRKVEALKSEVGSGWLSVLSEEGMSLAPSRKVSLASTPASGSTPHKSG